MNYSLLKKFRVILSLVFFVFIGFFFLDLFNTFPSDWINTVLYLQFAPSVIQFFHGATIAAAGFIFILILTLLFGRLYCSTLCPLGTFQDIFSWIGGRVKKRNRYYKFKSPFNWIRYIILTLTILSVLLSGMLLLVVFMDPYSIFGRIVANLFRPLFLVSNNLLAAALESQGIYSVYRVEWKGISWITFMVSVLFFSLIVAMSWKRGRLYCNTLCPVGTLLGIVSRISLFRITLDKTACTLCGKCAVVCKAECINFRIQEVDHSRCVGCLNCLVPCSENGVKYTFLPPKNDPADIHDMAKRDIIKYMLVLVAGLGPLFLFGQYQNTGRRRKNRGKHKQEPIPVKRDHYVSPPGARNLNQYHLACTACNLCVSVCPTQVLRPSLLEYGLIGMMQPFMDYSSSFCNYDCIACTEVCPTGALTPLPVEEKQLIQLGVAEFIKRNCIVHIEGTACGACSEHCPTKAVYMIPYKADLTIPEVNPDICIGCGACEYACPTDPKSIFVNGHASHEIAEKPVEEQVESPVGLEDDFPF